MFKVYVGVQLMWETDQWHNALEVQENYRAIYGYETVTISRPY